MAVGEEGFKPHSGPQAFRLTPRHARQYAELRGVGEGEARWRLERWRYCGVFVGGELVSVACAYLRLPEVWIIGDVYTHPAHRGRGYAKAATTAVTRDAIASGATAMLHVAEDNEPAIRAYRALGYRTAARRPWIFYTPPASTRSSSKAASKLNSNRNSRG